MSRTLTAHVSLWDAEGKVVSLAPGDKQPEWAVGRIGDHCLTPEAAPKDVKEENGEQAKEELPEESDGETKVEPEKDKPTAKPKDAAAPDFTAAATSGRRSGK